VNWVRLAQDRVQCWTTVNTINILVPYNAMNFLITWAIISFSRRTVFSGIGWCVC